MRQLILSLFFLLSSLTAGAGKTLDVYFIDVEGGQATLVVSPSGESLLVDTGWPGFEGRDAERIAAAAKSAGLKRIDYLVVTHYHRDHVGGVPELAERIPIKTFVDHGPSVETREAARELFATYRALRSKGEHIVAKPGDKIPIKGLDVQVVASAGEVIKAPLPGAGAANPLCAETKPRAEDTGENAQSVGILITYGMFRLLNLGDLTWNKELELVCPANRLGTVDLYLITHHGLALSGPAAIVHALRPRVAIMNNGARKGGSPEVWQIVRTSPGLEDIWQLHYSIEAGKEDNPPGQFIANMDEQCKGYGLKLSAESDGTFTVINNRTGLTKTYKAR